MTVSMTTPTPNGYLLTPLRVAMRARGMTQVQLAEAADVSVGTVRNLFRPRVRGPHPGTVSKIAEALGVEPASVAAPTDADRVILL